MAKLMDQLLNVLYYLGGYWRVNIGAKYVFVICTWLVMSIMWTKENTKGKNSCNILVWQNALEFNSEYDSVIFLLLLLLISYSNLFFCISEFYLLLWPVYFANMVPDDWHRWLWLGLYMDCLNLWLTSLVDSSRFPYLPAEFQGTVAVINHLSSAMFPSGSLIPPILSSLWLPFGSTCWDQMRSQCHCWRPWWCRSIS